MIDRLLASNLDPLDPLYLRINPKHIGVVGYSLGGWAATEVVRHSNARFNCVASGTCGGR